MNNTVQLSVTTRLVPTRFDVVQYATAPVIEFYISDYTPTGSARIYIEKPSGAKVYNNCTIDGQSVLFTPTTQAFAEVGVNRCQLEIMDGETVVLSFLIYANVIENIIDSSAVESTDEFTALQEALQEASDIDTKIATVKQEAQTYTDNAILSAIQGLIQSKITPLEGRVTAIEQWLSKVAVQLTMSVTPWSSGTCTVTGASDYSLFVVIMGNNNPIIVIKKSDGSLWGFNNSGRADTNYSQYTLSFYAESQGDVWTWVLGRSLTHQQSAGHNAGGEQTVVEVWGLLPNNFAEA